MPAAANRRSPMTTMAITTSRPRLIRNAVPSLLAASIAIFGFAPRAQAQGISLPGQFEVENFDVGGEGVTYHDAEPADRGGQLRPNEGVDIQATADTGGGYNVGWTKPGEWLRYTVTTTMSGTYRVSARVASNGSGGTFHVEIDGVNVTGSMTVVDTGGWQNWRTISAPTFTMTSGQHVLTLVMDAVGGTTSVGNFNWLSIARIDSLSTGDWTLAWSDEFAGAANTGADTTNWTYELGNIGAGNGELETYTDSLDNVANDGNGHLIITARQSAAVPIPRAASTPRTNGRFSTARSRRA